MTRFPAYLITKQIPDEQLLNKIKEMTKEGKSPKEIKDELANGELPVSLYTIRRYYTKIRKGIW